MTPRTPSVVVVGAGVAGLVCARDLVATGARVAVVDKGRGVGGRLATRRLGDATFDHGAQFVTARSPAFAAEVDDWIAAGVAAPWFDGVLGPAGIVGDDGMTRHRGVPGMTAIAKRLASGLDVRLGHRVERVRRSDDGWRIEVDGGDPLTADAVVLTAPAPQTLAMLDAGSATDHERQRLERIAYDPCVAVLAVLDRSPGIAEPAARRPSSGPVAWYADNAAKGVSAVPALTLHATPDASRALWDEPDAAVVDRLVAAVDLRGAAVRDAQVQRWRYSRATATLPEPCLQLSGVAPGVVAGDGFGDGGRVESAARSGAAAAVALAAGWGR